MDPVHPIWTTFGRNILLNPRNKLTEIFDRSANYEIGHNFKLNLKNIQIRYRIFFPRPMFSRFMNAMKLPFAFYDHSNYLKIQNGRHLGQNWCFET